MSNKYCSSSSLTFLADHADHGSAFRYATKLAGVLFRTDELLGGMITPVNIKYNWKELDVDRIALLKSKNIHSILRAITMVFQTIK